ncbi:PTS glucose transporter subunit IIA [Proteus mirabilis]|nr:PTS glucose transporter subunit IIA [Proteus mirabilis]
MSPLQGKTVALSEVNDETFASGIMGPGMAIIPTWISISILLTSVKPIA